MISLLIGLSENGAIGIETKTNANFDIYIVDGMIPEDVGLSRDLQFFKPKSEIEGTPRVTSATIYKCDKFEVLVLSFFVVVISNRCT